MTTIHSNALTQAELTSQARDSVAMGSAGDLGAAILFTQLYRGWLKYDFSEKKWFAFQPGLWWERVDDDSVKNILMTALSEIYLDAIAAVGRELKTAKIAGDEESAATLKAETERLLREHTTLKGVKKAKLVLEAVWSMSDMCVQGGEWDQDPWLIGVENGVVDLRQSATARFRPGQPDDLITKVAHTEWDESLSDELIFDDSKVEFRRAVKGMFDQHSGEKFDYLMRLFGYCTTGVIREKNWNIFCGEGGDNGKTTLMELIGEVLGPYAGAAHKALVTKRQRDSDERNDNLAALWGQRLVWVSETDKGEALDIGAIKWLTGNDSITCRKTHGGLITFKPTHHILLSTNHKPRADASDDPFWGRTVLITFDLKFVDNPVKPNERKVDRGLKDRILSNERAIVFRLLVEGCLEWQRRGLDIPECLVMSTAEYRKEQDIIGRWLTARAVMGETYTTQASLAYKDFTAWRKEEGMEGTFSNNTFSDLLKKKFTRKGTSKYDVYVGFGLRDDAHEPREDDLTLTIQALQAANTGDVAKAREFAGRVADAASRATILTSISAIAASQEQPVQHTMDMSATAVIERLRERVAA